MTTSLVAPFAEDKFSTRPMSNIFPMRKTLSLSGLFRMEKTPRSRPTSSDNLDHQSSSSSLGNTRNNQPKRIKRLSLRRNPSSFGSSSTASYSPSISSPTSPISSPTLSHFDRSSRIAKVASRCLFPDSNKVEEESFIPPRRPTCPAPLLDPSFEAFRIEEDNFHPYIAHFQSQITGKMAIDCPSEESFQCRGLEEDVHTTTVNKFPLNQIKRRPQFVSLLAPSALQFRPKTSLLLMESGISSPSTSSLISFEATQEEMTYSPSPVAPSWQCSTPTTELFCPPSPPPKVRLQLILPPTANLASQLSLLVDSNASTLELKETLSSTLLYYFSFSISPSNIALSFVDIRGEQPRMLENDRPIYQEGLQDDDEILVRF